MRWFSHPRWGLIRVLKMQLRSLREGYQDTLVATKGADLLFGNLFSYSARLVAERTGIAWASGIHIPMGFFSAYDPPLVPVLPEVLNKLDFLGPNF
jgi:rhamnosyltransferase subunit B